MNSSHFTSASKRRASRTQALAQEDSGTHWTLTLSDLMFLLLTFFVMRFAMGHLPLPNVRGSTPDPAAVRAPGSQFQVNADYEEIRKELLQVYSSEKGVSGSENKIHFADGVSVEVIQDKAALSVSAPFVDSSPEELTFRAGTIVRTAAKVARDRSRKISVTIFSDPNLALDSYSSDWELAEKQVKSVLRQMIDTGVDPQALFAGVSVITRNPDDKVPASKELPVRRLLIEIEQRRSAVS